MEIAVEISLDESEDKENMFKRVDRYESSGCDFTTELGSAIGNILAHITSPWSNLILAKALLELDEIGSGWDKSTNESKEAEQPLIDAANKVIKYWEDKRK
jgi:hypothetical protein